MHPATSDLRVEGIRPLLPPALLRDELPLSDAAADLVSRARGEIVRILDGADDRLVVVVGPCSVHDVGAAMDYAHRLRGLVDTLSHELCIVMRVYFEKPRTTVGWKGLIYDPRLDGTFAVNDGLRMARRLLVEVLNLGLPTATEFLDPISPQFFADAVTWAAIGARTTESQIHRQLASGLSMPVGFKNSTDGNVQTAIDALRASAYPHSFLGVTDNGVAAIVATRGNPDCHVVLRGAGSVPNYDREHVAKALTKLERAALPRRLMIDASHGNSGKDHRRQADVARDVAGQLAEGQRGIVALMLESFIAEGRQDLAGPSELTYGQSVTDACLSWDATVPILHELAAAVRARRAAAPISGATYPSGNGLAAR